MKINWILITLCNYLCHVPVISSLNVQVVVKNEVNDDFTCKKFKFLIDHELKKMQKSAGKFCYFFTSSFFLSPCFALHSISPSLLQPHFISFQLFNYFSRRLHSIRSDYGRNQVKKPAGHFDKWIITWQRHSLARCAAIFRLAA